MELKSYYAQDKNGAIIPGANVYLYKKGTTDLVVGLKDAGGNDLDNPFQADQDGLFQVAAPDGVYDLRVTSTGRDNTILVQFLDAAEAIGAIQSEADRSESQADRSTSEADRAESARDAAVIGAAGVFPDTASGLSATSSGEYFSVPSATDAESLILYLNSGGSAVEQKRYPSSKVLEIPFSDGDGTTYKPGYTKRFGGSQTGAIKLVLPIGFSSNRYVRLKLTIGNSFGSGSNIAKVLFAGWIRNLGRWNYAQSSQAHLFGDIPTERVSLGVDDSTGRACIVIGSDDTVWDTPSVQVDEVSCEPSDAAFMSGWSASIISDMTGVSDVVETETNKKTDHVLTTTVTPVSDTEASVRPHFLHLGAGTGHTGIKKILLPQSGFSYTTRMDIDLRVGSLQIGGQRPAKISLSVWVRVQGDFYRAGKVSIHGDIGTTTVRMGVDDATGKLCILIGDELTSWEAPYIGVDRVTGSGLSFIEDDWINDYAVEDVSDTSGVSSLTTFDVWKPDAATLNGLTAADISQASGQSVPDVVGSTMIMGTSKSAGQLNASTWGQTALARIYGKLNQVSIFESNVTPSTFSNPRCFNGSSEQIAGVGSYFEFNCFGESVSIFQAIRRTTDYAEFNVFVDGILYGTFNNRNATMGSGSDSFTTESGRLYYPLGRNDAYNIAATLDGSPVVIGVDADIIYIVSPDTKEQVKVIRFFSPTAAGQSLVINYDHGHVIAHEKSEKFESDASDEVLEDTAEFQASSSWDDAVLQGRQLSPSLVDELSKININFDTAGLHTVKIELIGGVNPYFCLNFAVHNFVPFVNAATGGWDLPRFLNDPHTFRDYRASRLLPVCENFVFEYGTNDDRQEIDQLELRVVNMPKSELLKQRLKDVTSITYQSGGDTYNVGLCTATPDTITDQSITSAALVGADVAVGDLVRIGRYYSSWREIAVRRISAFDSVTGKIEWVHPIYAGDLWHVDDLSDISEFAIRKLGRFKTRYGEALSKIREVYPNTNLLCVGNSNYNVNQYCSVWGQDEVIADLAEQHGGKFVPMLERLMRYEESRLTGKPENRQTITATGAAEYQITAFSNLNRAFKVMVDGENVLGKDCYLERLDGWYADPTKDGADFDTFEADIRSNFVGTYNNAGSALNLVFYRNAPVSGDIVVEVGDGGWTDDAVHPKSGGAGVRLFGEIIGKYIK